MKRISLLMAVSATLVASAQTPYISKVWEYRPAPGQFTNTMPQYTSGDDAESMAQKAYQAIGGDSENIISLGAWGGYVIFSFDHTVANNHGEYDFMIDGNAFYSADYPDGGSCEPGIVMVSRDLNGNGLPDDPWYQLAGSAYHESATIHKYELTYYRPETSHAATPGENPFITDATYIRWTDNCGNEGYVERNMFHDQNYWPEWIDEDVMVFRGTRLPGNAINQGNAEEANWVLYPFEYGYVDNLPNSDKAGNSFNLDWAVDEEGAPVNLDGADFFKVYTAVNQTCGWLGETSTEVGRATDLHPELKPVTGINALTAPVKLSYDGHILTASNGGSLAVYTLDGRCLGKSSYGEIRINLSKGIYVITADSCTRKIVVK